MPDPTYKAGPTDVEHLAELVCSIRPDWPIALVRQVLHAHRLQVHAVDLVCAAVRAAENPNYPTPKYIGWRGPHWRHTDTQPPDVSSSWERCAVCGKTEARCASERPGPDDHVFEVRP